MSPWCTSRAIPNLGSSPCPSRRPLTAPSTTGSGGASRPCSRTSRPAASAWRTARSSAPSAWTACFWSWRWPCSGPSRPACGMPSTAPRPTKKSPSAPAPQPPPRPDLALQARHPTTSGLPATSRSAAAAVERVGELMGGKHGHAQQLSRVEPTLFPPEVCPTDRRPVDGGSAEEQHPEGRQAHFGEGVQGEQKVANGTSGSQSGSHTTPPRRKCAAMQVHNRLLEQDPGFRQRQGDLEHATRNRLASPTAFRVAGPAKIPVVVHVVYRTDAENISKDQIESQIKVL